MTDLFPPSPLAHIPGSYNIKTKETIAERTGQKYGQGKVSINIKSPGRSSPNRSVNTSQSGRSTVGREVPRTPTGTFGSAQRSSSINRDFVKGGVVFNASKAEVNATVGPGSYQDAHYRGSPSVVASTMLHRSFNVRINSGGRKEGKVTLNTGSGRTPRRREGYEGSSFSPRPTATPKSGARINNVETPSTASKKKNMKGKALFNSPHFSRPHDRDYVTAQSKLNSQKQ